MNIETSTWSEHQYQIDETAMPKTIPVQGRSDFPGVASRKRCIASSGTSPQDPLELSLPLTKALKTISVSSLIKNNSMKQREGLKY